MYSRIIAIKDSKKDIVLLLLKAAELSILPLVGQNGFPHVTRELGAKLPNPNSTRRAQPILDLTISQFLLDNPAVHGVKYEISE